MTKFIFGKIKKNFFDIIFFFDFFTLENYFQICFFFFFFFFFKIQFFSLKNFFFFFGHGFPPPPVSFFRTASLRGGGGQKPLNHKAKVTFSSKGENGRQGFNLYKKKLIFCVFSLKSVKLFYIFRFRDLDSLGTYKQ